ncbi:hypothetical protein SAMN05660359_00410 [Geodermatophilus obscurus]|uniref:Antibiotic biosynthesis monooxygenase n=1 Tax=Geodermatophilus obscurus TaxID=1861 RepID=A0A1I5CMQ1_9ACTN|nr:hypothetical protein [Geodermatophilus obscurus]SFN88197.1 hypothetical protein SAMN05660359_00410 [Geodermatophilus obscurus]
MSLLVIHLRWTDAGPEHLARLQRLLPPVRLVPEGPCLHRRAWPSGSQVHGVEVWADDDAARRHLDELPLDSAAAGLEAPTVVVLVFPEAYRAALPAVLATTDAETPAPGSPTGAAAGR